MDSSFKQDHLDKCGKQQHHLVLILHYSCDDNCIIVGRVFYISMIITAIYNNE